MRQSRDVRNSSTNLLKVGLIIGGGTGHELGKIFRQTISAIGDKNNLPVSFVEFSINPRTYFELADLRVPPGELKEIEKTECDALSSFLKRCHVDGCSAVFRTAINAGTLYRLRTKLRSVKTMLLVADNKKLLLVRDQFQGFYSLVDDVDNGDSIAFGGQYSSELTKSIVEFSLEKADTLLRPNYRALAIYKYHLFASFGRWLSPFPSVELFQPDSGIDLLLHDTDGRDVLIIAANEVGDTLTEFLPNWYGVGNKATMCAKNICLDPEVKGLTVYQTIHGSADSIAGRGIVNPIATMRAAASIIEDNSGIEVYLEDAISRAVDGGIMTPDQGGQCSTGEVVSFILGALGAKSGTSGQI